MRIVSDNPYSLRRGTRARVTCTGHVHCKSLHRAPGALGQSETINQRSSQDHQSINPFHQWTALHAFRDTSCGFRYFWNDCKLTLYLIVLSSCKLKFCLRVLHNVSSSFDIFEKRGELGSLGEGFLVGAQTVKSALTKFEGGVICWLPFTGLCDVDTAVYHAISWVASHIAKKIGMYAVAPRTIRIFVRKYSYTVLTHYAHKVLRRHIRQVSSLYSKRQRVSKTSIRAL